MSDMLRQGLAALSEDVNVVDLHDRAVLGSRRITKRNRVVGSVAAATAIAAVAVAFTIVRPTSPLPPAESPSPTVSKSTSPTSSPTPSVTLPNVDVRNATFDVPAFPGNSSCPGGTRTFVDGKARINEGVLAIEGAPVFGDIDGIPGEEMLISMFCAQDSWDGQVLALKVTPEAKLDPLGFVLISLDYPNFDFQPESLRVRDKEILVDLLGPSRKEPPTILDLQTRGYIYEGAEFKQVSGPTRFADPPDDYRQIDFRNMTLAVSLGELKNGYSRTEGGTGEMTIGGIRHVVTVISSVLFRYQELPMAAILLEVTQASGEPIRVVNIYELTRPVPFDPDVITDIAGADRIEVEGQRINVFVNGQVWTYEGEPHGDWKRV